MEGMESEEGFPRYEKRRFCRSLLYENGSFAKTGSGQTHGKLKNAAFLQTLSPDR
jgi:hypothetical protein